MCLTESRFPPVATSGAVENLLNKRLNPNVPPKNEGPSITPAQVRQLAKEALESKGKLNNIAQLLELCESENEEIAYAAFTSMRHVYSRFLERGDLARNKNVVEEEKEEDVKTKVATWLRDNRTMYVQLAYRYLSHTEPAMQVAAMDSLMKVVKDMSVQSKEFKNAAFNSVVENVVVNGNMSEQLLQRIVEDLNQYDDVRYYFYKDFGKYLASLTDGVSTGAGVKSVTKRRKYSIPADKLSSVVNVGYRILSAIRDPATDDSQLGTYYYNLPPTSTPSKKKTYPPSSVKEHRKVFSDTWLSFLRQPMSADMHKRVLLSMHKRLIPYMLRPTLLIDFLVDSYDQGGAVSMLALNGLFTLVTEHNLDYPDFYTKLYALFDKNLLHVKYRSRFLRLVDLFLSSSQLPSYLIAAFIKKLTRLALNASPAAIITVVPFVFNLLKKHPACLVIIHREQEPGAAEMTDPYLPTETDPAKSRALESSLWEMQTLKTHYLHTISGLVRVFEQPIAKQHMYDMEDFLDHSYTSLFESETRKKINATAPPPAPALASHAKVVGLLDALPSTRTETPLFVI
ncbi:CBF/Mak21 family-domain-containing protein [Fimicolochytrium jonesii]|uniref:CBF/Mak21 family-domain-containing protein n=1 Tax=Fimicolochytrium jonesii TaxID=1396493 RepID=UPI0022FE4322|nr:CBF/Mak21 family-domain-containing protein [Fimicolochytrium jonesii]KAI8818284.1 CBF/Mak21 family-domain-containing protein [Fimicolochytrium jonesii]